MTQGIDAFDAFDATELAVIVSALDLALEADYSEALDDLSVDAYDALAAKLSRAA